MNQNKQQNSFMDPKTLTAVILSIVIFLGWSTWMKEKYPNQFEKEQAVVSEEASVANKAIEPNNKITATQETDKIAQSSYGESDAVKSETKDKDLIALNQVISVDDDVWTFDVVSKGMGVKNLVLKQYFNREKGPMAFGASKGTLPFESHLTGYNNLLHFKMEQVSANEIKGVALSNGMKITKVLKLDSQNYSLNTSIYVENIKGIFNGVTTYISENISQKEQGGFLSANMFDVQDFYVFHAGTDEREIVNKEEKLEVSFSQVNAAAIGSQYFTLAIANRSKVYPEIKSKSDFNNQTISGILSFPRVNDNSYFDIEYVSYMGPKSIELLTNVDENFASLIDLGFFGYIASFLLKLLVMFNDFVGNWGFSIILVTMLVRMVLLPTNISSFKSMRNMSKLNPIMKDIREKYKDDPQKRNTEIMALYKQHKVNPVGGCLPMLLQIPVFFALYQVLGRSIDLYQAPFIFWIQDLSAKDPYFVLPVLMGITMFFQQKMTPSTMEPAQQKMFMFMPLFFSFLMASLPSGLTLYMFVSGLFGIIQQLILTRSKTEDVNDPKVVTIK
ncbi:MAG: membrane protein insertase YidC [Bdellovibrionaceae bacterium]|nr:membrane protein insertase YidC [Pseudobdellovibrionaceae bacterium]